MLEKYWSYVMFELGFLSCLGVVCLLFYLSGFVSDPQSFPY